MSGHWIRIVGAACGLIWGATVAATDVPAALKSTLPPPEVQAKSWVLMDFHTGWVLAEADADAKIEPASLSKLMTAYVVFHALKKGTLRLDDPIHISEKAWRTEGSRMFAKVNSQVLAEALIKGLIIQSGNDAAVALAEHLAGTEAGFAVLMNQHAQRLGLTNSHFTNAPGLPDPDHYSTARDLSILTAALIREFPDYYKWYSIREFTYNEITQQNRNILLWRDATVDGVKTGHTSSAGYCLVGSARRDATRLIATVIGTTSAKQRANEVQSLLKYGFSNYESKKLFSAGNAEGQIPVYKGAADTVSLGAAEDVFVSVPRGKVKLLKTVLSIPESAVAPLRAGAALGSAQVALGDTPLLDVPLVTLDDVDTGSWWRQAVDSVLLWFQ